MLAEWQSMGDASLISGMSVFGCQNGGDRSAIIARSSGTTSLLSFILKSHWFGLWLLVCLLLNPLDAYI